jgi:hypothetical protein
MTNVNNLFLHSFPFVANHMLHNDPYSTGNYNTEKIKIIMQSWRQREKHARR